MFDTQTITELHAADPEPLEQDFLQGFCFAWYTAWNAQDYERVVSMCTDTVEWRDPTGAGPEFGRSAIRRMMDMLVRACPDYRFEQLEPAYASATDAKAIVPWRFTGTMTGPLNPPGFAPSGQRIEVHGDDHWEFRGGRLSWCEVIYDRSAVAIQVGAAPVSGSRAERASVFMQQVVARRMRRRPQQIDRAA